MPSITANPDVYLVPTNSPYEGSSVLANDVNSTNTTMYASFRGPPLAPAPAGAVFLNATGTFLYTAAPGFTGLDQFVYQAWSVDSPNDPNAITTAYLIVGNVPPPPGGGGNRAPIVAPMAARNDVEGRTVSVQVVAADPDNDAITYTAQNLPVGLSINQNTGLITGKLAYTCDPSYDVTITATDARLAATRMNFRWNVADATIGRFTGTEMNAGAALPNSVTVSGVTATILYLSPGNTLQLQVSPPAAGNLPLGTDTLYSLVGSGATPSSGDFSTAAWPNISFSGAAANFWVTAGVDLNGDGTLQDGEITQRFGARIIDFTGATVGSQRSGNGPIEPGLTTIKASEHFEVGAVFTFGILGGIAGGPNSMIRYEVWQSEWPNIMLRSGRGTSFFAPFAAANGPWSSFVRFYADANNNGSCDWGEAKSESPWFTVMQARVFNIKVDVSDAIGGGPAAAAAFAAGLQGRFNSARDLLLRKDSETDRRAAVQFNVVNVGVFRSTPSGGNRPDPVNNEADAIKHWDDITADVDFVNHIGDNNGLTLGWTSNRDWHRIVIGYDNCFTGGTLNESLMALVIAHELGHGVGLAHPDPAVAGRVMNATANVANNEIIQGEADAYDTVSLWGQIFGSDPVWLEPRSSSSETPSSSAPVIPAREVFPVPIAEFISPNRFASPSLPSVFLEPIPLDERTQLLDPDNAPILGAEDDWWRLSSVHRPKDSYRVDHFWDFPDVLGNGEGDTWNA